MIKEFGIKSCSECCFSNGGHLFAAQSGAMVSIFNFFTFELVATLRWALTLPYSTLPAWRPHTG